MVIYKLIILKSYNIREMLQKLSKIKKHQQVSQETFENMQFFTNK